MNRITTTHQASKGLHTIGWIATTLVIVGALNWLLVGLFDVDLIASMFGRLSTSSRIVYVLVGISGLYEIYFAMVLARESQRVSPPMTRTT